ncbi:MAG: hypothetical protein K2O65_06820 [Lachnospiraceae bacterium]|nr:hypothetical protein [Lachnospiraceae bacterium]
MRIAFWRETCYNGIMVNRVNGNDYYDYSQLKMPDAADKTDNGEKFSLNYQHTQDETTEKDKKKNGETEKLNNGSRTVLQGGVRLELSRNSAQTVSDRTREKTERSQDVGQNLIGMVQSWLHAFVQAVKDIANKIWNDPIPQDETSVEQIEAEDKTEPGTQAPERLTEEYLALHPEHLRGKQEFESSSLRRGENRDKEIQKYLRSGNLEQVINLVTDNGRKTMAKNSTLLTYYDRHGRIAPIGASDQERILHGDRNVKKL